MIRESGKSTDGVTDRPGHTRRDRQRAIVRGSGVGTFRLGEFGCPSRCPGEGCLPQAACRDTRSRTWNSDQDGPGAAPGNAGPSDHAVQRRGPRTKESSSRLLCEGRRGFARPLVRPQRPVDDRHLTWRPHRRTAAPVMAAAPLRLRPRDQPTEVPGRPDIAGRPGLRQQPFAEIRPCVLATGPPAVRSAP